MKITLSVDHRLIDGVTAANFLKQTKYYLEFPERFFLGGGGDMRKIRFWEN